MRKKCQRVLLPLMIVLLLGNGLLFAVCGYLTAALPGEICSTGSADMTVAGVFPVRAVPAEAVLTDSPRAADSGDYSAVLKLFGVIPVTTARVHTVGQRQVQVLGEPFGIKIYADGVLVVGASAVDTAAGAKDPAAEAGLGIGDLLLALNGQAVTTTGQVSDIVNDNGGASMTVRYRREGREQTTTLTPAYSVSEKKWRIGLWVRDSSAGIGTLTFYDPDSNVVAGLGHGITDSTTGDIIPPASGELVGAEILGVDKSSAGSPGELHGRFSVGSLGDLLLNTSAGVYGTAQSLFGGDRLCPVALKQEITIGDAELLTTLSGGEPAAYACRIEKITLADDDDTRDMIVRVTDPRLLDAAGGIVQGMSGSPILQNGKLVGAVTHVFVNDPKKGYAVFAETMLETAGSAANKTKLKDVS